MRTVTFGGFKGPADERSKEIFVDGVYVGLIERQVRSEQPGTSRAWKHTVTGYTVSLCDEDAVPFDGTVEFKKLSAALDVVRKYYTKCARTA